MREHDRLKLSILYVEDDAEIREGISTFLRRRVTSLITAVDGVDGLNAYNATTPDIIITDINMPNKNGLEMLREIRALNSKIIFIITSAYNDAEYFTEAIELGVSNFLIKPIDVLKLHAILERLEANLQIEKALEIERQKVQVLFNFQDNLVFMSNGEEIVEANQSFCHFFNSISLEEFKKEYRSIDPFIIEENGYFCPTKGEIWFDQASSDAKHLIKLRNNQNKEGIFLIKATHFLGDQNYYIVSLTDVTELEREKELLEKLATTDMLTNAFNRRHFTDLLEQEILRFKRFSMPFSLIMFDIDHFKNINDSYGHQVGDQVLIQLSVLVHDTIRHSDIFGRWGGEEFMLLLIGSECEPSTAVAENLRVLIENSVFDGVNTLSCSFGVTQMSANDTIDTLTKRVDDALYEAKNSGRNCVIKK